MAADTDASGTKSAKSSKKAKADRN
jgi:hypothetical protein